MSVHQIIYTSCMRGINGVNDGQQIFSYDARFEDFNNDDIKSLFSYQPPALKPGVIMTEEIAATLPHSFIFRRLEDGKCALSLSTYLGRDYMGSAGRFGNHLSHVVVADESDLENYPCEFYGGDLLRERMEFEEVNNPNPPDYLPTPVLKKGYMIDVETIIEFLSVSNRLEIYKNMLYAMLAFEKERKRVVICDEPENIVMWIAALEYAVPLKMALSINFTTYEFDPSLSVSQICGVVKSGTRYTPENKRLHFVFDLYQNECAEFDKETEFYDFIDTAFSLSFKSIQDFHDFIATGYTYEKADDKLYSAYALYSMLSDGISGITKKRVESALDFADQYAKSSEKVRITRNVVSQYNELLTTDRQVFLIILRYVFSMRNILAREEQVTVKNVIVDRILAEFLNTEITEEAFASFYNDTDRMCKQYGVELATELMQDRNRQKLFAVMRSAVQTWKIAFVVKIVSMYMKERDISIRELAQDKPMGQTYNNIIMAVYSQQPQKVSFLVTCILNEFVNDSSDLTDMTLNLEKMLKDLPGGARALSELWKYYGQAMVSGQKDNFAAAYEILARSKRMEQIFMLFKLRLQTVSDVTTAQRVFQEYFNKCVLKNGVYASEYCIKILAIYYKKLGEFDQEQNRSARLELFNLLVQQNINIEFSDELISGLLQSMPYKSPSKENMQFIQNAILQIYKVNRQRASGKLLLLFVGVNIENIENCQQVKEKIRELGSLTQNGRVDLTKLSEKSMKEYFAWILPKACEVCQKKDVMDKLYNLFDMSSVGKEQFFSECTNSYIKQCKENKDFSVFAEYFDVACGYSNAQIKENMGKALSGLNKKRMAELDETIRQTYETNEQLIQYWEDVRAVAETTTPLLNGFNNLIKEGKKRISLWSKREN